MKSAKPCAALMGLNGNKYSKRLGAYMKDITISKAIVIKAIHEDQIFREMDGESVILNIQTGTYCGLNTVGTRIWQIIQKPISVTGIRDTLMEEYNVEQQRCEHDLLTLLNKMASLKVVEVDFEKII